MVGIHVTAAVLQRLFLRDPTHADEGLQSIQPLSTLPELIVTLQTLTRSAEADPTAAPLIESERLRLIPAWFNLLTQFLERPEHRKTALSSPAFVGFTFDQLSTYPHHALLVRSFPSFSISLTPPSSLWSC